MANQHNMTHTIGRPTADSRIIQNINCITVKLISLKVNAKGNNNMTILFLGLATVLVPLLFITWLIFSRYKSKFEWLLKSLLVGGIVLLFFQVGAWSFSSYYLKYFMLGLLGVSVSVSYLKRCSQPWLRIKLHQPQLIFIILLIVCSVALNLMAFSGRSYPTPSVNLDFPLSHGSYTVLQGGSNSLTNPFHSIVPFAKYSIDIVKLNRFGNRAVSLFPKNLKQYNIFGTKLKSPCSGKVLKAVTNIPDNVPSKINQQEPAGNHIIIRCKNSNVVLAHLKQNSVLVTNGNQVVVGQLLGEVGNSGFSNEPHLHLQANSHDGKPIAMSFDGVFLAINDVYQQQ